MPIPFYAAFLFENIGDIEKRHDLNLGLQELHSKAVPLQYVSAQSKLVLRTIYNVSVQFNNTDLRLSLNINTYTVMKYFSE